MLMDISSIQGLAASHRASADTGGGACRKNHDSYISHCDIKSRKQTDPTQNAAAPAQQKGLRDALPFPLSAATLPALQRGSDAPPRDHPSAVPAAAARARISRARVGHRERIGRTAAGPSSRRGLAGFAVREARAGGAPSRAQRSAGSGSAPDAQGRRGAERARGRAPRRAAAPAGHLPRTGGGRARRRKGAGAMTPGGSGALNRVAAPTLRQPFHFSGTPPPT